MYKAKAERPGRTFPKTGFLNFPTTNRRAVNYRVGGGVTDNLVNKIIGTNICKLRTAHDMSQQELGWYLSVSAQQIGKYESGAEVVDPARLVRLARIFGCSVDFLCGYETLREAGRYEHDENFLNSADFNRTQALVYHFIRLKSPPLQALAYDIVERIAHLEPKPC